MLQEPCGPSSLVKFTHRMHGRHQLTHACPLQAAASAFNILFKSGGGSAVESVIPTLLSGLEGDDEQAAQALEGLRVILGVRPQTLGSMVSSMLCLMLIACDSQTEMLLTLSTMT